MNKNSLSECFSATPEESASIRLKELYRTYGYRPYRMSKFEEYDLYMENRSFIGCEDIITFNDFGGRLMALRPDVTVSIVKNVKSEELPEKLYYCENVYRRQKGSRDVNEILQSGLEYIGCSDAVSTGEVVSLACGSLSILSDDYILDISHMGAVTGILDAVGIPEHEHKAVISCIGEKNKHDALRLVSKLSVDKNAPAAVEELISLSGSPQAIPGLFRLCASLGNGAPRAKASAEELKKLLSVLSALGEEEHVRIDFSVVADMDYYNGVVFRGFIPSVPSSVLTGGRYDLLLDKFGKAASTDKDGKPVKNGAAGFAVMLGLYGKYTEKPSGYDCDLLLTYGDNTDIKALNEKASAERASGKSVCVLPDGRVNEHIRFKEHIGF